MISELKLTAYSEARLRKILNLQKNEKIPRVSIAAHVLDLRSGAAFYEMAFLTETSGYQSLEIEKELRYHIPKIRSILSNADAKLPLDANASAAVIKSALEKEPPRWKRMAPNLGWLADHSAFVLHNAVLGKNGNGTSKKEPETIPPNRTGNSADQHHWPPADDWNGEQIGFNTYPEPGLAPLTGAVAQIGHERIRRMHVSSASASICEEIEQPLPKPVPTSRTPTKLGNNRLVR